MARLVVDSGIDAGMVYPLTSGRITIGRSPSNTIQIIDKRTSRMHAEIQCRSNNVVIRDLGSKNGTLVNDIVVEEEHTLSSGDRVLIGETILIFERDTEEIRAEENHSSIRLVTEVDWGKEDGAIEAGFSPSTTPKQVQAIPAQVKDSTQRLRLLLQVGDAIRTETEITPLLETVMDLLFSLLQPDRAFIMLMDRKTQALVPNVCRLGNGSADSGEIKVSRTIVNRCLNDRVSILVSDALSDSRFSKSESIAMQRIRSAIVAPLIFQEQVFGVLYFDTKNRLSAYRHEELELATGIANQTAIALSNISMQRKMIEQRTLEREMEIAREIQTRLLPMAMPTVPGWDFAATSVPAKQVGGDYYDFMELSDGRQGIAIADVSGKGVPAAILTASVRSALQAEARAGIRTVDELLGHLNEMVYRDTASNMFVTMIFSILHPETGSYEYGNAGHPYPLLFTKDGGFEELENGGCFLGIGAHTEYDSAQVTILEGATLVLYSDGVTDTQSPSGELYGRKRLIDVVRANLENSAEGLLQAIVADTQDFQADSEQFDDFTLVIIHRN